MIEHLSRRVAAQYLAGNRKTAVLAINPTCNARCIMCELWQQPKEFMSLETAKEIIDYLKDNHFFLLYVTGGEPTLNPDVVNMVSYANQKGFVISMTTNGTVHPKRLMALRYAGLNSLSVSLDHADPRVCEEIRGIPNIQQRAIETLKLAKLIGLKPYALAYLNQYLTPETTAQLIEFSHNAIGVPFGFCYPLTSTINSYMLGKRIKHDKATLYNVVAQILKMKRAGHPVMNTTTYILECLRFIEGREPAYYCKAGRDVVFVDWHADLFPCFLKPKLFNVLTDGEKRLQEDPRCSMCLANCFREPSYLTQVSLPMVINEVAR